MRGAVPTTPRDLSGHRCRLAPTTEDAAQNLGTPERRLSDEHGLKDDPLLALKDLQQPTLARPRVQLTAPVAF